MSSTQNDRKLRSNNGRSILPPPASDHVDRFAEAVAGALRREFGAVPGSVKQVVRITGANERAVRNWFEARNAPSGENLVILMGRSDEVLETILQLAGRQELVTARRLSGARDKLHEMLKLIEDLQS
ncbi:MULTISPECIES: hypothetical protein [Brevundimonas]|uniref:XRE family transcriptional regulator n=1 Tax=Brevundimonas pondensis TaxID=2774189 RepID=A0ABX7SQA3_9CAUL|nr:MULTISPECIES: hypothetical protein [Brevundimonas]QTC89183.1 hypothetical protein IFE19_07610 [Brevundimonas pondensis]